MPDNILFKEENEKLFWEQLNKLIDSKNLSSRYLKLNIEYNLAFLENLYGDKSFIYLENNKPLAYAFLPIEKDGKNLSISFKGGYVDAPIFFGKKIREKVFAIIDKIAEENKISKIKFAIDVLSDENYNYLIEHGYIGSSILTYIFDLTKEDPLKSCRRNHQRNIKKIKDNTDFSVFYINKDNPSHEIHEEYRILHHKCSGRITRPKKTFDIQYEKLKQGNAVLFGLRRKDKNIAFLYFEYNADKAISASAADDPDYDKLPLYHILYYSGMEYLKKIGIRYIDTSQPSCPSSQFDYYIDKKQANIALFKRGFGGYFKENFRGIKYFSEEAFKNDAKNFIDNYSKLFYEKI